MLQTSPRTDPLGYGKQKSNIPIGIRPHRDLVTGQSQIGHDLVTEEKMGRSDLPRNLVAHKQKTRLADS